MTVLPPAFAAPSEQAAINGAEAATRLAALSLPDPASSSWRRGARGASK